LTQIAAFIAILANWIIPWLGAQIIGAINFELFTEAANV
jgi:hypothetical protein